MIDNPILNRPYDEPDRHFAFDTDGITDEVIERRRQSSYVTRSHRPARAASSWSSPELTADQIRRNDLVDRIREHVAVSRRGIPPT